MPAITVPISTANLTMKCALAQSASSQCEEDAQTATNAAVASTIFASNANKRADSRPCRWRRISAYSTRKLNVATQPVENASPRTPQASR